MDLLREKAFQDYRKKLMEHKEVESRLKDSKLYFDTSFFQYCRIIIDLFMFF